MARLALRAAVESPGVATEVVAVSDFPGVAQRYGVTSVPRVDVDDREALVGVATENGFLDAILGMSGRDGSAGKNPLGGADEV